MSDFINKLCYQKIPDSKKLIEKIKKCCSTISKFNLNSPCLLQFVRINGEYEVILTHNSANGDSFNFYKIFETVTYDEFHISEEDSKLFTSDNDRISIPIIVSSFQIDKNTYEDLYKFQYDIGKSSFYIFPKFLLQAIKENIIKDFEIMNANMSGSVFDIVINYDASTKYKSTLFIVNTEKLNLLFNISILPFRSTTNQVSSLYLNLYSEKCSSYAIMTGKDWDALVETHKFDNAFSIDCKNNHKMIIYHNDFLPKKVKSIYISKIYEERKNIVTLYYKVELPNNIFEYFKYKYYEV
jgi:hypothetical protein